MSAKDLLEIDMEDAVSLDQHLNSPIELVIGYITELKAQPGVRNDHFAVRLIGGNAKRIQQEAKVIEEKDQAVPAGSAKEEAIEQTMEAEEKEEDMELPMELDEKEAYNKNSEELFGEDIEKTET